MENEFLKRLISSLILLPIILGSFYLGGAYFIVLIIIIVIFALYEWDKIIKLQIFNPLYFLRSMIVVPIILFTIYYKENFLLLSFLVIGLLLTLIISIKEKNLIFPSFGYILILCPALCIVLLRLSVYFEFMIIVSFFSIVWLSDIGGYLFGKIFKGPRLIPSISPNKTISGAIGSLLLPLSALFISNIYLKLNNLIPMLLLIIIISILAQLGDLSESLFKRKFGVKNSGNIIPGHGGILDRIDSLIYTIPFFSIIFYSFDLEGLWN
ncbi:MAG: Phosphatidate cytidylyltransferase [Alphaproteobacteria bacterium MarineAlpha2_Bin1]|nr:MAG: Phosphatidate cytidylyltransferase [Alphaproteobacteria bacterium MarineAlpha2_Bin1]